MTSTRHRSRGSSHQEELREIIRAPCTFKAPPSLAKEDLRPWQFAAFLGAGPLLHQTLQSSTSSTVTLLTFQIPILGRLLVALRKQ